MHHWLTGQTTRIFAMVITVPSFNVCPVCPISLNPFTFPWVSVPSLVVSLTPDIFPSCLDLTCEWPYVLLSLCVRGRGGLTDENTWNFWICLSNSRNWITHKFLSKVLKFAAFQSHSGISVHLSVVFVQAWFSQKLFLQCILKGDGKYPSSVVPDFRSQDWTVMYWVFICMS